MPDGEHAARVRRARTAWARLQDTGGLVTRGGIAKRWGIGAATVRDYTEREDFPAPVAEHGRALVWLAADVDQWRATPRKVGRPRKHP